MRRVDSYPEGARNLVGGVTAVTYAALVLALPFIGDFGVPTVLVAGLWIGGSYVAGLLAPWRLIAVIPVAAAVVFVIIVERGAALDYTFFSDSLSILAVPPLAAGELVALYFGSEATRSRRRGRAGEGPTSQAHE